MNSRDTHSQATGNRLDARNLATTELIKIAAEKPASAADAHDDPAAAPRSNKWCAGQFIEVRACWCMYECV